MSDTYDVRIEVAAMREHQIQMDKKLDEHKVQMDKKLDSIQEWQFINDRDEKEQYGKIERFMAESAHQGSQAAVTLENLGHKLLGNGKPGFEARVTKIELQQKVLLWFLGITAVGVIAFIGNFIIELIKHKLGN